MKTNYLGVFCDHLGNEYEVLEEVQEVTFTPMSKPAVTREGSKSYITKCGEHLNYVNGVFTTLEKVALTPKSP